MAGRNNIDNSKRLKLTIWLNNNRQAVSNMTRPDAAKLASGQLGFKVTAGNIYVIEDALGEKLCLQRSNMASSHRSQSALQERCNLLEVQLMWVTNMLQKSGLFSSKDCVHPVFAEYLDQKVGVQVTTEENGQQTFTGDDNADGGDTD